MYAASALRSLRLGHGLKLSDIAQRADVSLSAASYAERDPDSHPAIADALRAAIDELARERGIVIEPDQTAKAIEVGVAAAIAAVVAVDEKLPRRGRRRGASTR